jgi:hypothetical protein
VKWPVGVVVSLTFCATMASPLAAAAPIEYHQGFQSPSANLFCIAVKRDGIATAQCETLERDWQRPPRPDWCQLSYGRRIGLEQGQPAVFICHGDTVVDYKYPVLDYGKSQSVGPITCVSQMTGMTCTDTGTGHYFTISRDSYSLG